MSDVETCSICTSCNCPENQFYDWDYGICKDCDISCKKCYISST